MNKKNPLFSYLVLILFQLLLLALFNLTSLISDLGIFGVNNLAQFTWSLSLLLVLLTAYTAILFHNYSLKEKKAVKEKTILEALKCIRQLLDTVRIQRHDFVQHVQTAYGLLEMEQFDEARKYLSEIFGSLVIHEELIKIRNYEILALLLTKIAQAESKEIKLQILAETDLAQFFLPAAQVNVILGNLIDNALEAVTGLDSAKKTVYLNIDEDIENYTFTVTNFGPLIKKPLLERIFEKGFTTKEKGKGLGLYSVKQTLEKLDGHIKVISEEEEGTIFQVTLPKGEK